MSSIRNLVTFSGALLLTLAVFNQSASAVPLHVYNHSFELPVFTDGNYQSMPSFAQQGGYGWTFVAPAGASVGVANSSAGLFTNAGGNNTPLGADGPQSGYAYSGLNGAIGHAYQILAGPDAIVGNGDDPVLTALTTYTITASVGRRLTGDPLSFPYGDLDIRLWAGNPLGVITMIGQSADFTPPAGQFVDVSFSVDSATLSPSLYGLPLSIQFYQNTLGAAADFDKVRIDAVPEPSTVLLGLIAAAGVGAVVRKLRIV